MSHKLSVCQKRNIPERLEIPEVPVGYSFCEWFKTEAQATAYADRYHKAHKCPMLVTYNAEDRLYTAWKLTGKAGRNIGWREIKSVR